MYSFPKKKNFFNEQDKDNEKELKEIINKNIWDMYSKKLYINFLIKILIKKKKIPHFLERQ